MEIMTETRAGGSCVHETSVPHACPGQWAHVMLKLKLQFFDHLM